MREIVLSPHEIIIRRSVNGVEMRIAVPTRAYRGVVLALESTASGAAVYRVDLSHHDADLTIRLQEALDDSDIVADWKDWSRFFAVPKFIEREPGRLEGTEERLGAVALGRCGKLRRRGATLSKRRPRAPLRRKAGSLRTQRPAQAS